MMFIQRDRTQTASDDYQRRVARYSTPKTYPRPVFSDGLVTGWEVVKTASRNYRHDFDKGKRGHS